MNFPNSPRNLKFNGRIAPRPLDHRMAEFKKLCDELDANDSWAHVELFRWQYGCLPAPTDFRPLDISAGLRGMAAAIEKGDRSNFPTPFNVASALIYAAKVIEQNKSKTP